MTTLAVREYPVLPKDTADKFPGGARLLYVGWDDHLMFCAPFAYPLPPEMPFGALIEAVLPGSFGYHPDWAKIDWSTVEWFKSGQPFTPDPTKSLAENGIGHKDALRFRTPGLTGIGGTSS
ncbi:MAG: phenol hydroxylase subunit P4 [Ilumatobacteraceae bacterium]